MSTYVIGDTQGCLESLKQLLHKIRFKPKNDTLWFTGDLINRGPESLETLRFVRKLGDNAKCVLGNHDLHLLAVYSGHRSLDEKDTLTEILQAPDIKELIDWLRIQPLMLYDKEHNAILAHAGLHPSWDIKTARTEASAVQFHLRSHDFKDLFAFMYGKKPAKWKPGRSRKKRLRFAINCFTRMRFCTPSGKLDFEEKGAPGSQPDEFLPWYDIPNQLKAGTRIIFGHWSTVGKITNPDIIGIDTGCVWGGKLTAYELEANTYHFVDCPQAQKVN